MPLVQIIGPVYNEEETIELFCKKLTFILKKLKSKYNWEIILVLDKSSDNTYKILKKICLKNKKIKLIHLSSRFGHQMSLVAGIDNSIGDIIIMMDTDLQHPPEVILKMINEYEKGFDIVAGIRKEPKDLNIIKNFGSKYFYSLMRYMTNIEIKNGEADFRLISKNVATHFKNEIREKKQFLRGLFSWVGFNKTYLYYDAKDRKLGSSKYNIVRSFAFAIDGIISFSKKPLRLAIVFGCIFAFLGILFSIYVLINFLVYHNMPPGWSTLAILVSVIGGVQLLFLGIIGEYIGRVFEEVKDRPLYIVKEKINL